MKMDSTITALNSVVGDADRHLNEVQNNVSTKINFISAELYTVTNQQFASENDFVKYQLAGTFTVLGCLIFLFHLMDHHRHYHKPQVQNRVMAVLWMVPIYGEEDLSYHTNPRIGLLWSNSASFVGVTSWLSLVFPNLEWIFGFLRDAYEAYAVYTFFGLLIAVLEDGKGYEHLIETLAQHVEEEQKAHGSTASISEGGENLPLSTSVSTMHIVPPCCCCYRNDEPISIAA
eukprot:gene27966-36849_t